LLPIFSYVKGYLVQYQWCPRQYTLFSWFTVAFFKLWVVKYSNSFPYHSECKKTDPQVHFSWLAVMCYSVCRLTGACCFWFCYV